MYKGDAVNTTPPLATNHESLSVASIIKAKATIAHIVNTIPHIAGRIVNEPIINNAAASPQITLIRAIAVVVLSFFIVLIVYWLYDNYSLFS